jgi:hypothetical protein
MAPKAVDARKRFNRNRCFRRHGPLTRSVAWTKAPVGGAGSVDLTRVSDRPCDAVVSRNSNAERALLARKEKAVGRRALLELDPCGYSPWEDKLGASAFGGPA